VPQKASKDVVVIEYTLNGTISIGKVKGKAKII